MPRPAAAVAEHVGAKRPFQQILDRTDHFGLSLLSLVRCGRRFVNRRYAWLLRRTIERSTPRHVVRRLAVGGARAQLKTHDRTDPPRPGERPEARPEVPLPPVRRGSAFARLPEDPRSLSQLRP